MNTTDLFARQAFLDWLNADLDAGVARCRGKRLRKSAAAHRGIERHRQIHGRNHHAV